MTNSYHCFDCRKVITVVEYDIYRGFCSACHPSDAPDEVCVNCGSDIEDPNLISEGHCARCSEQLNDNEIYDD